MIKFYIKFLLWVIVGYSVFASIFIPFGCKGWYQGYAFHSDWRNKECDYSTNYYCCNYYNGGCKWYRIEKFGNDLRVFEKQRLIIPNEILNRIQQGDTIRIGIDKYALFSITGPMIPAEILKKVGNGLLNDKVYVCYVYFDVDNNIVWRVDNE